MPPRRLTIRIPPALDTGIPFQRLLAQAMACAITGKTQPRFYKQEDTMALYVHAITGYYSLAGYRAKARLLYNAGFIRCKGCTKEGGSRWRFFALTDVGLARGVIAGKTEEEIVAWLKEAIQPGSIEQTRELCAGKY